MKTITILVFAIMLFASTTAVFADCHEGHDAFDSFKCVPCQMADDGD